VRDHSVWVALTKGWVAHLDRGLFDVHIFHLGRRTDRETEFAKSVATYTSLLDRSLRSCCEAILAEEPDVLIYPEVGMDMAGIKLASMRLGPVQIASWGHPETTGMPTIDYYLSAELLEPPNAQENYTEQLVLLPNLGCTHAPLELDAVDPGFDFLDDG